MHDLTSTVGSPQRQSEGQPELQLSPEEEQAVALALQGVTGQPRA